MTPMLFEKLLSWVGPTIERQKTKMRLPIGPSERLSLVIRYLASGDAQSSIASSYRISPSVVSRAINEVCAVIWEKLSEKGFLRAPHHPTHWKQVSSEFDQKWNFPHALGAIDGKHIVMQCPARGGSDYFNYKKTHSIVLLALCNGNYEFLLVDIGDAGRQSDGSVYSNSDLGYAIDENLLNFPAEDTINGSEEKFPYVILGDDAFGLKAYLLKPYPGTTLSEEERIFNYRLSRGRRIVENTFGIAASRFRVLRRPIIAKIDTVVQITKAIVALHNFLMSSRKETDSYSYCPVNYVDQDGPAGTKPGEWRMDESENTGFLPLKKIGSNNYSKTAKATRDLFKRYFNSAQGSVPWQTEMVRRVSNPYDEHF